MFGFFFQSIDKEIVTHGLKKVFRQRLEVLKTNPLDKRLDWVMFGGRKMVPTASNFCL
ncbi:unnamed protein product [Arabidopsis halleri]